MQEPQPLNHAEFSTVNKPNSFDAAEQLAALISQHALVAQQLCRLSFKQSVVESKVDSTWNRLANQVARLRFEVEDLKRTFAPPAKSSNAIFVPDDSVEFLFAE